MNKHELTALAERVEAAEGPSRELDRAILVALGKAQWRGELLYWMSKAGSTEQLVYTNSCPAYTASTDAALTLVPGGRDYSIERVGGEYWAAVDDVDGQRTPCINGATPALALVAAALRSQAQGEGGSNG